MDRSYKDIISSVKFSLANERYDTAIEYASKAVKLRANDAEAYSLLGTAYLLQEKDNDYQKAEQSFYKAIELDNANGEYYFFLANSQFAQGESRLADALANYAKAEQVGCSAEVSQKINYVMGVINQVLGNNKSALVNYAKAQGLAAVSEDNKDILLNKLEIYVQEGNLDEAENIARQLINFSPEEFKYYHILFQILMEQKKIDVAIEALNDAQAYSENYDENYVEFVFDRVLADLGMSEIDSDNAQKWKDSAVEKLQELSKQHDLDKATRTEIEVTIAQIYITSGREEEAVSIFEDVAKLADNELDEYIESARYILSEYYNSKGNYKKVLEFAVELKKSSNFMYKYQGIYSEAYATKQISEGDAGLIKKARELYDWALAYFRQCMVEQPADFIALSYRIRCYIDIGKIDRANELLKVLPSELQDSLREYIAEVEKGV